MESSPLLEAKKRIKQCLKNNSSFLDLSKLDLRSVPELKDLPNLKKIDLSNNKITQIENLEVLTDLIELNLGDNNIEEIKNINKLNSLEIINLTNNNIIEIYNLENCTNLKYLYLGSNKIKEIKGLETLSNLIYIHLYHNNITKLDNLHNLKNLEVIFLGGNKISKIENLNELKNLKVLNIYENKIKNIENLDENIKLEELVLHDNPLENINGVEKLKNLNTLLLGRNSLKSINEVRHLIKLTTFSCNSNYITDITPLLELSKISYLILSNNKIKNLKNIDNLKNLEILDLSNNLIRDEFEIEKIKLLPNLRKLRINNNPIWKNYDISLDEKWDTNHLEFYKVFVNEYSNYNEITLPYNVVLLGNHSAGKSSLLHVLTGKKYNNKSTHGLKIEFSPQKNKDFPICVYYDFGGQDFYHGVYRLFLKEKSFKILVVNPDINQNKLRTENLNTVINNQKNVQDFTLDYWSKQIDFNDITNKSTSDIYLIQSHYNKNQIKRWEYITAITKRRLNTFSTLDLSNPKSPENIYFKNYLLRQITDVNSKVKISNTRIQLMKDILENIKKAGKSQCEPIPILELKNKYESLSYPIESFRVDLDQLSASGLGSVDICCAKK